MVLTNRKLWTALLIAENEFHGRSGGFSGSNVARSHEIFHSKTGDFDCFSFWTHV